MGSYGYIFFHSIIILVHAIIKVYLRSWVWQIYRYRIKLLSLQGRYSDSTLTHKGAVNHGFHSPNRRPPVKIYANMSENQIFVYKAHLKMFKNIMTSRQYIPWLFYPEMGIRWVPTNHPSDGVTEDFIYLEWSSLVNKRLYVNVRELVFSGSCDPASLQPNTCN